MVASETGHVYTFATPKLQPLITKPEGKNLIQSCLNAPEVAPVAPQPQHHQPRIQNYENPAIGMYPPNELREPPLDAVYDDEKKVLRYTTFSDDLFSYMHVNRKLKPTHPWEWT